MRKIHLIALAAGTLVLTGCDALTIVSRAQVTPTILSIAVPTAIPMPTPTSAAVPNPSTATPNPAANPLETLKKVLAAWASARSFRGKSVQTGGVTPGESTFEVVMPDRFHIVGKSETIIIGNVYYLKQGTKWTKQTLPQGFDLGFADNKKILDQLGTSNDVKFIGPDSIDGAPMLVYQYSFSTKIQNTTVTTSSKVWVAADGLPRKSETSSSNNPGVGTVVTYYDYNAQITINAPIP